MNNYSERHTAIIVDDNPMARILLRQLLEQIPFITVAAEYDNARDALEALNRSVADLLFLDVEMPGMSGIELLRSLPVKPITILTSGSKGYGPEAYELNVIDYLVKPLYLPRLLMAINKANELLQQKNVYLNGIATEYLFIRENKIIRKLLLDSISLLESMGDYVKIYTSEKTYVVHATLKLLEDRLPVKRFMRVHRSFIVAMDKIDYIEENTLYLKSTPVPLSESYKSAFNRKLNLL
ncbi:MAG: response regulator transcription factor [Chitinophagaceae bacterium]|nr:response regulator transcription factor [Chitinophagaceae bacterium]